MLIACLPVSLSKFLTIRPLNSQIYMLGKKVPLVLRIITGPVVLLFSLLLTQMPVHAQSQRHLDSPVCTPDVYDGAQLFVNFSSVASEVQKVESDNPGLIIKVRTLDSFASEGVTDIEPSISKMTQQCPTWAGPDGLAPNYIVLVFSYWDRHTRYKIGSDWGGTLTLDTMQEITDSDVIPVLHPVHTRPDPAWDQAMNAELDAIDGKLSSAGWWANNVSWVILLAVIILFVVVQFIRSSGSSSRGSSSRGSSFFYYSSSDSSSSSDYSPPSSPSGGGNF